MTNQEAIDLLDNLLGMIEDNQEHDYDGAIHMAIEALSAEVGTQMSSANLINRQDAIKAISEEVFAMTRQTIDTKFLCMSVIERLPSAQRKGKWEEMGTNTDGTHNIKCSKCGEGYKTRGHARSIATKTKYKFCPNCGARMVSEDDTQ